MEPVDWKNGDNQITVFGANTINIGKQPLRFLSVDVEPYTKVPFGLTQQYPILKVGLTLGPGEKSKYTLWYDGKYMRIKPDYINFKKWKYSYVNPGLDINLNKLYYLTGVPRAIDTWPAIIDSHYRIVWQNANLGHPIATIINGIPGLPLSWCGGVGCNITLVPYQQWISLKNILNCCSPGAVSDYCETANYSIKNPVTCPAIMYSMCKKDWVKGKGGNQICQSYLDSYAKYPGIGEAVTLTVSNEINKRNPSNYNSSRDGKDPFYTTAMPFLCSSKAQGACDSILSQYCSQFTIKDLQNDVKETGGTLINLCGCHLSDGNCPVNGNLRIKHCGCDDFVDEDVKSLKCTPLAKNQYAIPGPIQDTSCMPTCHLPQTIKRGQITPRICPATTCIFNDININSLQSGGPITFEQVCGSNGQGNCYISDIDINKINSSGKVTLEQKCGACFQYDPTTLSSTQVNCGTLKPGQTPTPPPTPPPQGSKIPNLSGITAWFSKHRDVAIVGGLFLLVLVAIIIFIIYGVPSKRRPKRYSEGSSSLDIPYGYNPYVKTC